MQLRSYPDFMHGDFGMFSRVRRSIESLCLTSGQGKIMLERSAYEVFRNIKLVRMFSSGAYLEEVEIEKIYHYAQIRYWRGKDIVGGQGKREGRWGRGGSWEGVSREKTDERSEKRGGRRKKREREEGEEEKKWEGWRRVTFCVLRREERDKGRKRVGEGGRGVRGGRGEPPCPPLIYVGCPESS